MKKTYFKPAIEVTAFIAEDIITSSQSILEGVLGTGAGTSENASSYSDDSRLSVAGQSAGN